MCAWLNCTKLLHETNPPQQQQYRCEVVMAIPHHWHKENLFIPSIFSNGKMNIFGNRNELRTTHIFVVSRVCIRGEYTRRRRRHRAQPVLLKFI